MTGITAVLATGTPAALLLSVLLAIMRLTSFLRPTILSPSTTGGRTGAYLVRVVITHAIYVPEMLTPEAGN
jgi:hypothetical protein